MGRRGPRPEPTVLRILKGNTQRRPIPTGEPTPPSGMPACPAWLPADAKNVWKATAPRLHRMGLLTMVDAELYGNYCLAQATLKKAQKVIDKHGLTFTTPAGYVQQRPEVSVVNRMLYLVKGYGDHFGLSPSARTRIELKPEGIDDDAKVLS